MRKFKNEEEAIQVANEFIKKFVGNNSVEECVKKVYNSKWGWDYDKSQATATAVATILMKKVEALKTAPEFKKGKIIRSMETVLDFFDEFATVRDSAGWTHVDFPSLDKDSPNYDPDYARAWTYTLKTFKKECAKEWGNIKRENGDTLGAGIKDVLSGVIELVSDAFSHTPPEETPEEKQEREERIDYLTRIL